MDTYFHLYEQEEIKTMMMIEMMKRNKRDDDEITREVLKRSPFSPADVHYYLTQFQKNNNHHHHQHGDPSAILADTEILYRIDRDRKEKATWMIEDLKDQEYPDTDIIDMLQDQLFISFMDAQTFVDQSNLF
jgi:hypothetical protein